MITSEATLATQMARIANPPEALGCQLKDERRLMTREEANRRISHSAFLLRTILDSIR